MSDLSISESLRDFKRFVTEVSSVTTIPGLLQCTRQVYTKLLPESCFCLWLWDEYKKKFCRWVFEPKMECIRQFPVMVSDKQEPLRTWFQATEPQTITTGTCLEQTDGSSSCSQGSLHLIPLSGPGGAKLLLAICSAQAFLKDGWFQDFLDGLSHAALQALERVRVTSEAKLLSYIARLANQSENRQAFLDEAVLRVCEAFSAEGCSLFIYDELRQKLALGATTGLVTPTGNPLTSVEYDLGEGLTGWIGQQRSVVRFFDTQDESERHDIDPTGQLQVSTKSMEGPLEKNSNEPRQFLGLPILLGAGVASEKKLIGVLRLHKKQFGVAFFPHDVRLGRAVCHTLASAIERWNLTERESKLTSSLFDVSEAIQLEDGLERILRMIVEKAMNIFDGCAATLFLRKPGDEELRVVADIGYEHDPSHQELVMTLDQGLVGAAAKHCQTVAVADVIKDSRYYLTLPQARSEICTPILFGGECRGVLSVESDRAGLFSQNDLRTIRIIEAFAQQAAVALHRAEVSQERAAWRDQLVRMTGLVTASNVASGLAHELKNGLTIISTLANSVERDPAIRSKKANLEKLDLLQEHSTSLFQLAQRLMNLSRAGEMQKQTAYLNDLVQDAEALLRPLISDNEMELELKLDPSLSSPHGKVGGTPIEVDRRQIAQVITNLVLNAVDASEKRQKIVIRTNNRSDQWVEFGVRDFGMGIKPEDKRRLFNLFFTTKSNGFGVGLYVAHSLIQQHGGQIEFDTKPGAGTLFTVRLPKKTKVKERTNV